MIKMSVGSNAYRFFSRNLQGLLCKYLLNITCNYKKEVFVMVATTLREVCGMVGVSRRMVQCYEQAGLVASTGRNKYGYLLYDEEAVKRIQEVKMYQHFGFALKDIKVLLSTSEEEYVELMNKKLADMKEQLIELEANVTKMEGIIAEKQK